MCYNVVTKEREVTNMKKQEILEKLTKIENNEMGSLEFAGIIASLSAENQNEFFKSLKGKVSDEDLKTVMSFVSLWSMFKSPAKYEAMKNAVCDQLCEEIYGHTVEKANNVKEDAVLVGMYSNSIL